MQVLTETEALQVQLEGINIAAHYGGSAKLNYETRICAGWAETQCSTAALEEHCPVGRVDVVLRSPGRREIVEAKKWRGWKHALGQVLAYSFYYKGFDKSLLLIGRPADHERRIVEDICKHYEVKVYWHD